MNRNLKTIAATALLIGGLTACSDDADVASKNISKAADNFEVQRRVVVFNGITDQYLLEVTGRCSILDEGKQLEITCKIADDKFIKHFAGLSDKCVLTSPSRPKRSTSASTTTGSPSSPSPSSPTPTSGARPNNTPLTSENQQ